MQGFKLDASKYENIMNLCEKVGSVDLIINALPLHFAKNVLDAAIELKTNYQDFAAGEGIKED
jgi:saccharopine dehydrogenase-like NADP-dependent oxidoreductase